MDYRSYIASAIKNGGFIKTSRYGLVPSSTKNMRSITSGLKQMKLGSGTPAHKKINELQFLSTTKTKKTRGTGLKSSKDYKPLTLKF